MSLGGTFAVMDNKVSFPKHQRMVKRRKWQPKSSDETSSERRWTWFFQGFVIGFSLVAFIAGIWWFTGVKDRVVELAPPQVYVVPDRLIAAPGDELTLTPVFENMVAPISIVWTAEYGEGLPKGRVEGPIAMDEVHWTVPKAEDVLLCYITATVEDSKHRVAFHTLTMPVSPSKQP